MAKDFIPSNHPLTPPLTEEDWLLWLRLLRSPRVGISTFFRLLGEHGTAAAALDALPVVAESAGVTDYRPASAEAAIREWAAAQRAGVTPIAFGDPAYPPDLADISDAPPILWTLGDMAVLDRPLVALVGARNASSLGTRMARRLAAELGEAGFTIVSGLARGVDTAAHLAALDSGTIAVMAGGVDVVYPAENAVLAQEIGEKGLRISEMPMHLSPQARHFPRRNRIISGLARAVVVVEAAAKSGSLITARTALDQGREVLAVPGHPVDARAAGCNMLLRDGATLVRSARDVIEAIGLNEPPPEHPETPPAKAKPAQHVDIARLHAEILERIGPSPTPEDDIIRDLAAFAPRVGPEIASLELQGRLIREDGGLLTRPT